MTVAVRVIPCLDVHAGRVVKGVNFVALRDAGDPVELGAFYDAEGADELTFLDISASVEGRETTLEVVRRTAETVFIPLTVGGGISSVGDVDVLLRAGADKVAINTGAIRRPEVIGEITRRFGNQVLVLSVDARRADWAPSGFEVTTHGGRTAAGLDAIEWTRRGVDQGVGEILLNSMDADGTTDGFDLEMIRAVRAVVDVPLIASGGAGRVGGFSAGDRRGRRRGTGGDRFSLRHVADRRSQVGDRGRRISGTPCRARSDSGTLSQCRRRERSFGCRTPAPRRPSSDSAASPTVYYVDCYRADGDNWPDTVSEVELYVLPYMKGEEVLDRVGEMSRLKVIQTLTAGVENFLPYRSRRRDLVQCGRSARRQHR